MDATFRVRRQWRNLGVIGMPFSLAWCAFGAYVALTDPVVRHRWAALLLFAGVPLLMAGLSLWLLLAYLRHSFSIRGDRVISRGVFGRREIDLSDVVAARWKTRGASLVLQSVSSQLTIQFATYEREDRERLVRHLRAALPREIQTGWNLFAYKITTGEPKPIRTKPGPDEVLVLRDRWDRWLLPATLVAPLLGVIACWATREARFLIVMVVPMAGWAVLQASTPREGIVMRRLSRNSGPFLVFCLVWCILGIIGLLLIELLRPKLTAPDTAMIVLLVIWGVVFFVEVALQDRRESRRDRVEAELAAKARGETVCDPWRTA